MADDDADGNEQEAEEEPVADEATVVADQISQEVSDETSLNDDLVLSEEPSSASLGRNVLVTQSSLISLEEHMAPEASLHALSATAALDLASPRGCDDEDGEVDEHKDTWEYEGDQDDEGNPHGIGMCSYDGGSSYEGEWVHGIAHGRGVFKYPTGSRFVFPSSLPGHKPNPIPGL